jgi:hypothetical protein
VSLRAIAAATVLVVALPIVLLLGWSAQRLHDMASADAQGHAQAMTRLAAARYSRLLSDVRVQLGLLAQVPNLADGGPACTDLLRRLQAGSPEYANLGIIGRDGQVRCSALPFAAGLNLAGC